MESEERHRLKEFLALLEELEQESKWIMVGGKAWHLPTKIEAVRELLDNEQNM